MPPNEFPVRDYVAIAQLKNEYCHRIDSGDYAGWAELFTEDGSFQFGDESFVGRDRLQSFAEDIFDEQFGQTAHIVTTPVIDVDGERASGRFYLYFLSEGPEGNFSWTHARYHDEFRQVDGEWKIASVDSQQRAAGEY